MLEVGLCLTLLANIKHGDHFVTLTLSLALCFRRWIIPVHQKWRYTLNRLIRGGRSIVYTAVLRFVLILILITSTFRGVMIQH